MLSLGIDIGTSGVRTAVLEGDTVVSSASADHFAQADDLDATLWWNAVAICLHDQMAALDALKIARTDILRIAVDGTSGSMVLTDADLKPVSPALMYNTKGFDAEAAKIAVYAGDDHITSGSNSALARAMRLVNSAMGKPRHLLHQADFIAAKLMGQGGHSDFNNALKTGFDPETERWPLWIGEVIDPSLLPSVHCPGDPVQVIGHSIAQAFGLSPKAMVHAGTTDSIAAFLACSPIIEGNAVTSLGSTLAIKLLSKTRIDDPKIGLYSHRLGDLWLVGGASNTGGAVLKCFFTSEQIVALSARIDPSQPSGLSYYPLLQPGERFPINDPNLAPRMTPRPSDDAEFLYGLLEGIAMIEARCYAEIKARGGDMPNVIFTAGGGSQNEIWAQIRSRQLSARLEVAQSTEAAIGAARLASTSELTNLDAT